jgi:hypothetical protein
MSNIKSNDMLKRLFPAFAILSAVFLVSCLDTEEKIVINKNNSGVYTVTVDMSKMLVLFDQMGQGNKEDLKIPEQKDTTIYFKPFADTSTMLTARERELFKEGSLRMRTDEVAKELVVILSFPFKHIADLPELKSSYFTAINKLGISDKLKQNEADSEPDEGLPSDMSTDKNILNPSQDAYAFAAASGKISNTLIDKELFNSRMQNDSSMQMLQQMTMMMGDMNYKTVIVAPGKIKKYKGNQSVLSNDKKTVTFTTTLSDVLNRPEAAEYNVEY